MTETVAEAAKVKTVSLEGLPPSPECDKLQDIRAASIVASDFYDWLAGQRIELCQWVPGDETDEGGYMPILTSPQNLMADFFGIDLDRVEQERRAILEYLRKRHEEAP